MHSRMRVHVQGGSIKLVLPIPEPEQNITWLKNDFKLRALRRGNDVTVTELSWNGSLLDDDDKICDVVDNFAYLNAAGPGIEPVSPKVNAIDHNGDSRTKRKYTRGGHKKLKLVAPILESYLPEMSTTSEKERQKFYAKIVSLPQMVAADVNRDEVVSWYKRARKKTRTVDDPSENSRNNNNMNDSLMNGMMSLDGNLMPPQSMMNDHGMLDNGQHLMSHGMHQMGLNGQMGQMMHHTPGLDGLGGIDGTNQRPVREMAPEELAYAEPASQAAYVAAINAQQSQQSMPPPPIVAPVAATQPVVGL